MRSTDFPFAVMPQGYAVRRFREGGLSAKRKSQERAFEDPEKLASGVSSIPRRVVDYFRTNTPSGIISDIGSVASSTYEAVKDDPGQFAADAILSPLAAIRDFADLRERARELRAQGLNDEAEKIEAMTGVVAMSAIPIVGRVPAATAKSAMKKSVKGDAPTKKVAAKATSSAYSTPRQVIAKEFGRDIAQRLDGIVPADAPITEWRAAAENLSSPDVAKSNRRFIPEFKRPSEKPLATQMGEQGLPVRGMDLVEAQHPSPFGVFSKYKTPKDPLDTEVVFEPYAAMPTDRRFDTNRLENVRLVSLLADKSRAGDRLLSIDGSPIDVYTQGGPMHAALQEALGGSSGFANTGGGLSTLRKQIAVGLEEGRPVFGVTTTMGPDSLNQTVDMVDTLHQMARTSPIRESDLADFNEKARSLLPGYAGLLDEDAVRQLQEMTQGQRKAFVKLMDNADALKQGFPSVPAARFGLTDPNLVDVPSGVSGYSFVELGPESLQKLDSSIKNRSYAEDLTGEFAGRGPLVPFNTMFSDFVKTRRAAGKPAGSDLRSLEFRKPFQDMTPEAYDRLMRYLSKIDDPY